MSKRVLFPSVIALGLIVAAAVTVVATGGPVLGSDPEPYPTPPAWVPPEKAAEALPPTPTALPLVGPTCPVDEGVCDAARASVDLFNARNPAAIAGTLTQVTATCPPTGERIIALGQACDRAAAGATVTGYRYFGPKQAFLLSEEALVAEIARLLTGPTAPFRAVAVACPGDALGHDCSRYAAVTLASPRDDGTALVFVVPLEFVAAQAQYLPVGLDFVPSLDEFEVRGGTAPTSFPSVEYPATMWFIPWDPGR